MSRSISWLPVFFISIFILIPHLGLSPVFQASEGREGFVVQEMMRTGQYVLPLRHGEVVPSKPVLFHWIVAGFSQQLGRLDAFVLRLPSALAAGVMSVMVFLVGWRSRDSVLAYGASAVLITCYAFVRLAGDGRVDMLFNTCIVAAIIVWLLSAAEIVTSKRSPREISNWTYFFFALFSGLAVLVKGPLGILLPIIIVISITTVEWGKEGLVSLLRPVLLISVLVPLPWYLLATLVGEGPFIQRQILFENFYRFTGGAGVNTKPLWFYLQHFWTQAAPWSFVFIFFLTLFRWPREDSSRGFAMRSACVWILVSLLFLSVSSGKRRAYLLPVLPAMALYIAACFSIVWEQRLWRREIFSSYTRFSLSLLWLIPVLITLGLCVVGISGVTFLRSCSSCVVTMQSIPLVLQSHGILLFIESSILSVLSCVLLLKAFRHRNLTHFAGGVIALAALYNCVLGPSLLAVKGYAHSYQAFAEQTSELLEGGQQLVAIKDSRNEVFDSFFFHLNKSVKILPESSRPPFPQDYYLVTQEWFNQLSIKERGMFAVLAKGGRKTDSPQQLFLLLEPR
jgi:hypothetical protein